MRKAHFMDHSSKKRHILLCLQTFWTYNFGLIRILDSAAFLTHENFLKIPFFNNKFLFFLLFYQSFLQFPIILQSSTCASAVYRGKIALIYVQRHKHQSSCAIFISPKFKRAFFSIQCLFRSIFSPQFLSAC